MNQFNTFKATRYGTMIYNRYDMYVGRSLDLYGEYSQGEIDLFSNLIQPNIVVLDVGANIGAFTLYFAKSVLPHGIVYAFEPQRIVFQTLAGNMAINSITNVYCINKAVGKENGKTFLPPIDYSKVFNFGGISLFGNYTVGEEVEVITIDSLNLPHCHFMKIDVEGMEVEVLKGAKGTIDKFRPVLYVENDREERADELTKLLKSLNYDMYWHTPYLFNPNNFFNNQENVFGNIISVNLFCIPSELNVKVVGLKKLEV